MVGTVYLLLIVQILNIRDSASINITQKSNLFVPVEINKNDTVKETMINTKMTNDLNGSRNKRMVKPNIRALYDVESNMIPDLQIKPERFENVNELSGMKFYDRPFKGFANQIHRVLDILKFNDNLHNMLSLDAADSSNIKTQGIKVKTDNNNTDNPMKINETESSTETGNTDFMTETIYFTETNTEAVTETKDEIIDVDVSTNTTPLESFLDDRMLFEEAIDPKELEKHKRLFDNDKNRKRVKHIVDEKNESTVAEKNITNTSSEKRKIKIKLEIDEQEDVIKSDAKTTHVTTTTEAATKHDCHCIGFELYRYYWCLYAYIYDTDGYNKYCCCTQ